MDTISGGTIATDGVIKLTIDSDKIGYIKLPNGSFLTTVAGVIDTTNTGISGSIVFYSPKTNAITTIASSEVEGKVISNITKNIVMDACSDIVTFVDDNANAISAVSCPKLTSIVSASKSIVATGSSLSNKAIGDILYNAYRLNYLASTFSFGGGLNAIQNDVDAYLISTYGILYEIIYARLVTTNGGTILIDTV